VEHAYGPWLAEGNWWQRESWELEQWDLVARPSSASGDNSVLYCCLVRDLKDDSWQMVTLYD
jgi:protein ImuB